MNKILILGCTGTIGQAVTRTLVSLNQTVVCVARTQAGFKGKLSQSKTVNLLQGAEVVFGNVTNNKFLANELFSKHQFDVVISCLASRTGEPDDAWEIDYQANINILSQAKECGVKQMIFLSAICVQKPSLEFQHAKLAFESALINSGLIYSIVRPTAFFKSLSGQISRLKQGKAFFVFGDGTSTACKPISELDLAEYIADCIDNDTKNNKILPIGGPGPAITPLEQGNYLFSLLAREPHFKHIPTSILHRSAKALSILGKMIPKLSTKAELLRIAYYYSTESMLVFNKDTGSYDANATPETGQDTLYDYYQRAINDQDTIERGDHTIF